LKNHDCAQSAEIRTQKTFFKRYRDNHFKTYTHIVKASKLYGVATISVLLKVSFTNGKNKIGRPDEAYKSLPPHTPAHTHKQHGDKHIHAHTHSRSTHILNKNVLLKKCVHGSLTVTRPLTSITPVCSSDVFNRTRTFKSLCSSLSSDIKEQFSPESM